MEPSTCATGLGTEERTPKTLECETLETQSMTLEDGIYSMSKRSLNFPFAATITTDSNPGVPTDDDRAYSRGDAPFTSATPYFEVTILDMGTREPW